MKKNTALLVFIITAVIFLCGCDMLTNILDPLPEEYIDGIKYSRDYPDDELPIYDDAIVYESDEDDDEITLSFGTEDDMDDVIDFYEEVFDESGLLINEIDDGRKSYEASGVGSGYTFELEIKEAKGKYEERTFTTVVEIKIIFTKITNKDKGDYKIGVLMPTMGYYRWADAGNYLAQELEAQGYIVSLQFADNNSDTQISQIEQLISAQYDVLIIAPVYGFELNDVLGEAVYDGIVIISYDRLITETEYVDYYVTFDNEYVGTLQGEYIVDSLGLDKGKKGPFNMEIFAGSPDDYNAKYYNKGAMDVLEPYIESGVLNVVSGEGTTSEEWSNVGIQAWSTEGAETRMENLLRVYYANANVDVILSPNDSLAQGIAAALDAAGYGTRQKPYPIITGQDCDINSIKNIVAGKQSMSVFKNPMTIYERTLIMVDQICSGEEVETNNYYDNYAADIPSYLCKATVVDADNYWDMMIESGFYSEDQLR
ncbi:MAG: sugar-binding protein [Clostridia bacterium]|nr:sugar-binding protein [Clostridia bacterium]